MTSERTILITGVTGNQGGAVAHALQGTGFSLRGLTRKPDSERAAALARRGTSEYLRNERSQTISPWCHVFITALYAAAIKPAEIRANSEAFTTTVLPAATGEMTARHERTFAPFHGVKLATTPSGRRRPIEWRPG